MANALLHPLPIISQTSESASTRQAEEPWRKSYDQLRARALDPSEAASTRFDAIFQALRLAAVRDWELVRQSLQEFASVNLGPDATEEMRQKLLIEFARVNGLIGEYENSKRLLSSVTLDSLADERHFFEVLTEAASSLRAGDLVSAARLFAPLKSIAEDEKNDPRLRLMAGSMLQAIGPLSGASSSAAEQTTSGLMKLADSVGGPEADVFRSQSFAMRGMYSLLRPERLPEVHESLRREFQRLDREHGFGYWPTVFSASMLCALNMALPRQEPPEAEAKLIEETISLAQRIQRAGFQSIAAPESPLAFQMFALHRARRPQEIMPLYLEFVKVQERTGVEKGSGYRYMNRAVHLAGMRDIAPDFVAKEWLKTMQALARQTVGLAELNSDLGLRNLSFFSGLWSGVEFLADRDPATFLEGYIKATGLIRNLPFMTKMEPRYGAGETLRVRDIQSRLSPRRPLVVYVRFTESMPKRSDTIGAFFMDGSQIVYRRIGTTRQVNDAVSSWQKSLRGEREGRAEGDPSETALALFDLLLRPIVGSRLPPELYIVPDEAVGQVSFAALRSSQNRWLVEDTAVAFLGAMRDLVRVPDQAPLSPPVVLQATRYRSHSPLQSPVLSARALRRLDSRTTVAPLTDAALRTLKSPLLLHVSAHGVAQRTAGNDIGRLARNSSLVVPGVDNDISITARDIAQLNLRGTKAVILASCDGADADVLSGEGMGGIRRALYLAGAQNVIASLGLVRSVGQEAPGDRLLAEVYTYLQQGVAPAVALQRAQISMLRDPKTASPTLWGKFICEGAFPRR